MRDSNTVACDGPNGGGCEYDNEAKCILSYPEGVPTLDERTLCPICLDKALSGFRSGVGMVGSPSGGLEVNWFEDDGNEQGGGR